MAAQSCMTCLMSRCHVSRHCVRSCMQGKQAAVHAQHVPQSMQASLSLCLCNCFTVISCSCMQATAHVTELHGGAALQLHPVCQVLLDTARLARTSPDIIDSSTSPAPLSSTMSQVALPRWSTTTSPGTRRRDDKAIMRPTHTNGTTHCWSKTLQLPYRTVRITYSYCSLCICTGPCRTVPLSLSVNNIKIVTVTVTQYL